MSRFFSGRYTELVPYVPGEQPKDSVFVKLNTNESPFSPSENVVHAVSQKCNCLNLYSDPECFKLREKMAQIYNVTPDNVIMSNGSDEILNIAFMSFADDLNGICFPNISYGFYPVFAQLNNIEYTEIPLKSDFSINVEDYMNVGKTVVIANPNAPTGMMLSISDIERILISNKDNVVIIDEAYIDFGGESATKLISKYDNLLVVGTFSKSRSMAGARLGFAIGNSDLIKDLNTIRYSINPYNVNSMTMAAGIAALDDNDYYMNNCKLIIENREWTTHQLELLGFDVLPSMANFVFAKCHLIDGEELYLELKKRGILVRHFSKEAIKSYNRITIGTREQMETLISNVKDIIKEKRK